MLGGAPKAASEKPKQTVLEEVLGCWGRLRRQLLKSLNEPPWRRSWDAGVGSQGSLWNLDKVSGCGLSQGSFWRSWDAGYTPEAGSGSR